MDLHKLLKTSIVLMEHHRGKTLDARTVQNAIRIIYMDDVRLNSIITNGTKYVTVVNNSSKKKILNWSVYKNAVGEFMKTEAPNITTTEYVIGDNAITYLTAVADTINNQVQQF